MDGRNLSWDGCLNVRDLGGHATEDGRRTRFGGVVRADSVRKLSDEGWNMLVAYGVETVVDLRVDSELAEDAPRDVPVGVVHVSLVPRLDDPQWLEIDAFGDGAVDHVEATRLVYLELLERFRPRFGEAMRVVAGAPEGTVVIHCLGGKDRTGLVAALLLRLAGVGIDEIAADYAASGENLREMLQDWIDSAEDDQTRARRQRISATPAAAMVGVLETVEHRYGSVEGYLREAGVGDDDLARLRARLAE